MPVPVVNINGIYSLQNIGGTSSTNFYDLEGDISGTTTTSANITASNSLIVDVVQFYNWVQQTQLEEAELYRK